MAVIYGGFFPPGEPAHIWYNDPWYGAGREEILSVEEEPVIFD